MEQFRLTRRKHTTDTQFDIDLILGKKQSPYAARANDDSNIHEDELNMEMQRILANAITKVLDQKSIRETAQNMGELVVEAIQTQMDECTKKNQSEMEPQPILKSGNSAADPRSRTRLASELKSREEQARQTSKRNLTIAASKKLLESLRGEQEQLYRSGQDSQGSLLKSGLQHSMSKKGFGPANEHGLKS